MIADFSHLPTHAKFIALMPQWDFLNFLAEQARRFPSFRLLMETEAIGLTIESNRVAGLKATTTSGTLSIQSDLTVAADGRDSRLRASAGLVADEFGVPIDVLWMRLSRRTVDPGQTFGYITRGHVFVMLDRGDYWQCAFVIPKGGYDTLRAKNIESLRTEIAAIVPFLSDRVEELREWDDVKLLTVRVNCLREWSAPGFLCIGDSAHAMSPIGGVGINLAIQDAVAAANLLTGPLRRGAPSFEDLRRVQRRREFPTRVTQRVQMFAQNRVLGPVIAGDSPGVPLAVRLLDRWPVLRRIPARFVGLGVRPEHVSRKIAVS